MLWLMWILEAPLFIVIFIVLMAFAALQLSKRNLFLTRLETGDIKFIDVGDSFTRMICDVPGYILNDDLCLVPDKRPNKGPRKIPFLGLYWVGIPGVAKVHNFEIMKEKENPSATGIGNWIIKKGKEMVSSLRSFFPRPFEFLQVELGSINPASFNILAVGKFRTVKPIKLVYELKGDFSGNTHGILAAAVADELKRMDLETFLNTPMGEDSELCATIIKRVNSTLTEQTGLEMVGLAMRYDPGNDAIKAAMQAKTIAFEEGEGIKATADAMLHKKKQEAAGRQAEIEATLAGFGGNTQAATEVLTAQAQPNLTTKVTGGATPVVTVGGDGK